MVAREFRVGPIVQHDGLPDLMAARHVLGLRMTDAEMLSCERQEYGNGRYGRAVVVQHHARALAYRRSTGLLISTSTHDGGDSFRIAIAMSSARVSPSGRTV